MKHLYSAICILGTLALPALPASAQRATNEYHLSHKETPEIILPYSTTLYSAGQHEVHTMRGDVLLDLGKNKTVAGFALSPAGNLYFLIESNKKGERSAALYSTEGQKVLRHKYDAKKFGTPLAATFTPDARMLAVATDKSILLFDTRKFQPAGRIDLVPLAAERISFSPNGYFLAIANGKDVVVYNFETKKIRTRLDAEVGVNDILFSPDSQTMALLSSDGLLSIYDTRTFDVRTMIDDLGDGLGCTFNDNGKYIAVAPSTESIEVINLLRTSDRKEYPTSTPGLTDLTFIHDSARNPMMAYSATGAVNAFRMLDLEPNYSRLVSDAVDEQMAEWLKMQPGESLEQYQARVNDESRQRQRRLLEDAISTELAGDLLSMSNISLGNYDRSNGVLAVEFSNLPPILLPVNEADLGAFTSAADLTVSDAQYGLLPDDSFELIYAKFLNRNDNKTYIYDNIDRRPMEFLANDADFVSLDIIRQQQMEEIRLQEVKEQVMMEAKQNNVISDHTHITVDSRVQPDYDADGAKILNYVVKFTYQVEPEFSAVEDFPSGKYHVDESGAASSMLKMVKQAFEGDLAQYLKPGTRLNIHLSGTADASPILRPIAYDGAYGEIEDEPVSIDGTLTPISVSKKSGIASNEQLAFLRAAGVHDYLDRNVEALGKMDTKYDYEVSVSKDKGGAFRRITAEFTFLNAF